ncbi:MAG: hypothetical protein H0X51_04780 [Parachlamydiaceae bacterium]|nr:hypothetical protein [Parachlamydiaceae bacterium]
MVNEISGYQYYAPRPRLSEVIQNLTPQQKTTITLLAVAVIAFVASIVLLATGLTGIGFPLMFVSFAAIGMAAVNGADPNMLFRNSFGL